MYKWGRGDYGVFGDGNNKSLLVPKKNTFFTKMQSEGLKIKKIKTANNYSMALMGFDFSSKFCIFVFRGW